MNSFIKDLFSVGFAKGAIIIFGICTSSIVARWLGPDKVGVVAVLMIYPAIFMSFGSLGVRQSVTYFTGKKIYSDQQIASSVFFIWMFTSLLSIAICFFLIRCFSSSGSNLLYVLLALLPIPFKLFVTYLSGISLGKNDISTFNRINWLPPLFILLAVVCLVVLFDIGIPGVILAYAIGPFVLFVIFMSRIIFKDRINLTFNPPIIKSLISLGLVYAFALVINVLNYSFDVILLDKLSSSYEVGIYSRGSGLAQYLWQIPMILGTIVFARSAIAKDGKAYSLKVVQLMRLSMIAVGLGSLLLFAISPFVIQLLYGVEFFDSIIILRVMLPGIFLLTMFKVMNMDLAGKGKPWVAIKAMGPALVTNISLNILMIPQYGALGAAMASVISYTLATLLFIKFYRDESSLGLRQILYYRKADFDPIVSVIEKIRKKK